MAKKGSYQFRKVKVIDGFILIISVLNGQSIPAIQKNQV